MAKDHKEALLALLDRYRELGISNQIDYDKFYLYSIIAHSTAIEGSTVTEVEAQLLFDEGITSSKRTLMEQMMNLDLKNAYEYGLEWIKKHPLITSEGLILLASKVMAHTGSEYNSIGGHFDASKGELRKLNVTAGFGSRSYMAFQKVPGALATFCEELNHRRHEINVDNILAVYELSFWAHYELVTIHPWADGNGRTCRLLMNLIQAEFGVLPVKVMKEDKAEYIQTLIETREKGRIDIFVDRMTELHCRHLEADIDRYVESVGGKMVDKSNFIKEMVDKWSINSALAVKLADILLFVSGRTEVKTEDIITRFGFSVTTAKRYLRQLVEFGYLESRGGNKNRKYEIRF